MAEVNQFCVLFNLIVSRYKRRSIKCAPIRVHASLRRGSQQSALHFVYYRVTQNNCAPFVWLLWRSCRFNFLGFAQLHRTSFNLEFETVLESIWVVVADFWQRKGKVSGYFKYCTSIVLQKCPNELSFQRKGSGIVLRFSLYFSVR